MRLRTGDARSRRRVGGGTTVTVCAVFLAACSPAVGAGGLPASSGTPTDAAQVDEVDVRSPRPATGNDLRSPRAQNSPQLAVDPTNEAIVALANRWDAPDFSCALQMSVDGGRQWGPVEPVPQLPKEAEKCYAPKVAFDADGTLYYLFVGLAGQGNRPVGVYLTTSADGGRSFTEPRQVLGEGNYQVTMAMDRDAGERGRIYLVWLRARGEPTLGGLPAPPNPIMAAHSDDGGRTFSDPVQISDPDRHLRAVAPNVAVGADGAVHVAYFDLQDDARDYQGLEGQPWSGTWSVVHHVSRNGGESFEAGVVVDDALEPAERVLLIFTMPPPALAADDAGNAYVGWKDARHGDADVFVARSRDAGAHWSEPVRVNDDPTGNGKSQLLPQLDVAPGGRVDAVFLDRRDSDHNVDQHVYYAASTDRGESFGANQQLTRFASSSQVGQRYAIRSARGRADLGRRLGLVAQRDGALVAWPDSRHALPQTAQQEIFTTRFVRPEAEGGLAEARWWPILGGAATLLAVGLALLVVWRRRAGRERTRPPQPVGEGA
jgi:hypothetical protein